MAEQQIPPDLYGTSFSIVTLKEIAEATNIPNLPDGPAGEVAEDITIRLKRIIQNSAKFMHRGKRSKLLPSDIDRALKLNNYKPQYEFHSVEYSPFRSPSGGSKNLRRPEEQLIDLNEVVKNASSTAPLEVALRPHWLVIDGVQPTIPENPLPVPIEIQKIDAFNPVNKIRKQETHNHLATHELSVVQQLYYKEITESCVGLDGNKRSEALQSLSTDSGLHAILPRLCTFIIEGVRVNLGLKNFALLMTLLKIVKALLDNSALNLEKYLHVLLPSVITCIVTKTLCINSEFENHYVLRDFASRLIAQICKNYNTTTNNIQTRVTRLFSNAFVHITTAPLGSLYGALVGLASLGIEVIMSFILPRIKAIGARIEIYLEDKSASNQDKKDSEHIKMLMLKIITPIVNGMVIPLKSIEEYQTKYGYLGAAFYKSVIQLRKRSQGIIVPINLPK